jgi:hypothetical protein
VCEETCLNPEGAVVGSYVDSSGVQHGYVRASNGTITEYSAPGAGTSAGQGGGSASVTALGVITGYFFNSDSVPIGFVRTPDGKFTTFNVPGSSGTAAFSLNLLDTVTGVYADTNFAFHGYSRSAFGTYAFFDAPDGGPGAFQGTRPSTNNLEGEVAGWVTTATGEYRGFVWQP